MAVGEATCTGCGCTAKETGEYSDDNPVETDGTYADGKFVCTACYCLLIDIGKDIGAPREIQKVAEQFIVRGRLRP